MQNVKKCVRSGFLLLLSLLLILPTVFAAGAVAPAALAPELAQPFAADNVPSQTVEAHTAATPTKPTITVEGNAVITPGKQLTGFFEVTVLVKTPANQPFSQAAVTLKYDSTILTPVTWDEVPATIVPTAVRQNVPVLTPRQNTVVNAAETYTGTAGTGILTLKMTAPASGLVCADTTAIAVVRFQYDKTKYPMIVADMPTDGGFSYVLGSETPKDSATDWPAGVGVKQKTVLYLANDAEAKTGYLGQSVWYQAATVPPARPLQFYYYNGAPTTSGTVSVTTTIDGAAKKWDNVPDPATVGAKVLSQKAAATAPTYTENLLTTGGANATLVFTFVNKETAHSGTAGVGGIMLLLYDWDNALVGSKIIAEGDVKADVEQYVTANLVHPDLKTPAGDLQRKDSYRGVYDADPNTAGNQNIVQNGPQYRLTNKLDYAFATWQTAETVDDKSTADPTDDVTYHTPDKTQKSYANGWARIPDGMAVEDVWTTFNVGELKDLDPAAATPANKPAGSPAQYAYATQKESAYFHMVDFTKIGIPGGEPIPADKVLKVKAVYQEGGSLDKISNYTIAKAATYDHINSSASTVQGNAYSVSLEYERVNAEKGVIRTRDPVVRITFTPDNAGTPGGTFLILGPVSNSDVMTFDITAASAINSMTYMLGDLYGQASFATAAQRSEEGNQDGKAVLPNFNYAVFPYSKRLGSEGFIYRGTMNQILYAGTEAVRSKDRAAFNALFSLPVLDDLNLRESADAPFVDKTRASDMIYDAIARAYRVQNPATGPVDLDWHQLQYHILKYDWLADGDFTKPNGIFTPGTPGTLLTGGEQGQCAAAMNPKGFAWCRLDNCHGKGLGNGESGGIKDLLGLVTAADKGEAALADLTTKGLTETFHLAESVALLNAIDEPTFYTDATLGQAKTDLVAAVRALKTAGKTLESITWDMLQYQLDQKASIADAGAYGKEHYWWFEGGKKVTDLPTLLAAAELSFGTTGLDGRNAPLNTATLAFLNQTFRPDLPGTEYPTKEAFIADVKSVVKLAHTAGKTLPDYTWDQLQFALINDRFGTALEVSTQSNASYWWKDGGKKVTDIPTFQQAMKRDKEGYQANLNTATLEIINDKLNFRKNFKGTPYSTGPPDDRDAFLAAVRKRLENVIKPEELTWEEMQYFLIHGIAGSYSAAYNEGVRDQYYWWKDGATEAVIQTGFTATTTIDEKAQKLVEFAYRAELNGNVGDTVTPLPDDGAWTNAPFADITDVFRIYKDNLANATELAGLTKFQNADAAHLAIQKLVRERVEAAMATGGPGGTPAPEKLFEVPVVTWYQLQDYLITGVFTPDEANIVDKETKLWWKEKDSVAAKVTELTPVLLAMEGWIATPPDENLFAETIVYNKLNDEFMIRRTTSGGRYTSRNQNAARTTIKDMATAVQATKYYDQATKKIKLDWYQIQFCIFNPGQIVAPAVAKAEAVNWKDGGGVSWVPAWADNTVWTEFSGGRAYVTPFTLEELKKEEIINNIQDAWEAYRLGQITLTEALRIDNNAQAELIKLEKLLTDPEITHPAEETPPGKDHETAVPETPPPNDENVILMKHFLTKIVA